MLRIAHLTDLHLPGKADQPVAGRNADQALESILGQVLAFRPDLLLLTGDLADAGDTSAYLRLRHRLRPVNCAVLALPGNHDHPTRMRRALGIRHWGVGHVMCLGEWRIIGLSSHWRGHADGRLGQAQRDWLDHRLIQSWTHPTLIAVHHPPIATGSAWLDAMGLRDAAAFRSLLRRHPQVRAVLFGHGHQAMDLRQGGCRFLGTPSTVRQFLPLSDHVTWSADPGGWRWLTLSATGCIHTQVVMDSMIW
ncbi:MAG TPA: metallophosphoesterase [Candidatus Macondimonas sp.]|nr:metallophosphoesterase [Candidatus Macondimonas sp.]